MVGSANMDLVVTVPRAGFTTFCGGKGANQAIAAARAGGDVCLLGAVGQDDFGRRVLAAVQAAGVEVRGVRLAAAPTGTAHILVDATGENSIVVVAGANATVADLDPEQRSLLDGADLLLVQLELPVRTVVAAARAGRERGARVVLTPAPVPAAPVPAALWSVVDVVVPNEHEAQALTGQSDPVRAGEALLERVPAVVVTLGAAGCLYLDRAGRRLRQAAVPVAAVDTTGAGDAFVGALAVALAEGTAVDAALAWACAAAALAVGRPGASRSMPDRAQIDAALAAWSAR